MDTLRQSQYQVMPASSLEKLQRRAARIIVKTSNSEQAMSSLAFDLLADRRDKHVLRFVKKCIQGKAPQFFSNYFKSNYDISTRITRQQHHLHLRWFETVFYFPLQLNFMKDLLICSKRLLLVVDSRCCNNLSTYKLLYSH